MGDTYTDDTVLELMKCRLNRLHADAAQATLMRACIEWARDKLQECGVTLGETPADVMLLLDMAVWKYGCRDSAGAMPEWLRRERRDRWMKGETDSDA